MLTDSLTSAIVLPRHSARSEGMQLVHRAMLDDAEFQRIARVLQIAHFFGPANVFADAVSRGYFGIVDELRRQVATRRVARRRRSHTRPARRAARARARSA